MRNPHDLSTGGHEPVDVDPFIPTGQCALCVGMAVDERVPEDRGPENPYESGLPVEPMSDEPGLPVLNDAGLEG